MRPLTFVVPAGAEAAALRGLRSRVVVVPAGAASAAALPPFADDACVVVAGLCGALGPLAVGDVVVYDRVAVRDAAPFAADPALAADLAACLPLAHRVSAVTTPTVVTRVAARAALRPRFDVVDMEGTALAQRLTAQRARWGTVRVVSDDAQHDLPPIEDAFDGAGRLRPAQLAIAFARAPVAAARFIGSVRAALAVLRATARAIDAAFTDVE